MTDIAARSGAGQRAEIIALKVLVGAFLLLRLSYTLKADLLADEARDIYTWRIHRGEGYSP